MPISFIFLTKSRERSRTLDNSLTALSEWRTCTSSDSAISKTLRTLNPGRRCPVSTNRSQSRPFLSARFFVLLCVLVLHPVFRVCPSSCARAQDGEQAQESSSRKELVDTIITGINYNNSQLDSLQATFDATVENLIADKASSGSLIGESGATSTFVSEPKHEFTAKYVMRGSDVRLESDGQIWILKEGSVSQYVPSLKQAWVRRPADLPRGAFPPLDFRRISISNDARTLAQMLQEERILSAQYVAGPHEQKLIRVMLEPGNDRKVICEFDSSRNFLPITAKSVVKDGHVAKVLKLGYQQFIPGCWVLKTAIWTAEPDKPELIVSLKLRSVERNVDPSDQLFAMTFPDGTFVKDNVTGQSLITGTGPTQGPSAIRKWRWLSLLLMPVIVLLFLLFRMRKYVTRSHDHT